MRSRKSTARLIGALYMMQGFPAALSLTFFPKRFLVLGNAAATAANIESARSIYRLWALADVVAGVLAIWMAIALYQLFKDVHRGWAGFVVGALFVMVPMSFAITIIQLGPLVILNGSSSWAAFDRAQLESLAYGFLMLREQAVGGISAYWGIWLIPVAVLVYRSGFLPRFLGILVGLAAFAYTLSAMVFFIAPASYRTVFWAAAPIYAAGEVTFILYLLIKGVRTEVTTIEK